METQEQPDLEKSVAQVMKALPPPVREFLSNGSYTAVARELTAKHGLHVDQGGILEREMMLLLMGTEETSDFVESLVNDAKIPQKVVEDIIDEINQRIFIPLREEIRKGFETFGKQSSSPSIHVPTSQQRTATTALKPQATTPQQTQLQQAILAAQKQSDEKLLEDHEEPHIEFKKQPVFPVPPRIPTPPSPNLSGAPISQAIPPGVRFSPRPIAPTPAISIVPPAPAIPTKPIPPTSPIAPASSSTIAYSTDPYREPIDENKA